MILAALSVVALLVLPSALAAPSLLDDEYPVVTEKRAALVLDRLLVALQHALHEGQADAARYDDGDGPRTAPLRIAPIYNDMSALQRRGQASVGRGRVLRCYFNAITCF